MTTAAAAAMGCLHRALRDRRGVAAVEFAIVAAPFIFMLFALIECGLILVASIDLSNATMSLGRQIRTGNLIAAGLSSQTAGVNMSLADFKSAICTRMQFIPVAKCTAQLQVDLRATNTFGSGQGTTVPVVNGNFDSRSLCYYSGASGSVVEFRAYYLWAVNTPLLLGALVNATNYTVGNTTTSGNFHVIVSSEAFRVEQNSSGANSGSNC